MIVQKANDLRTMGHGRGEQKPRTSQDSVIQRGLRASAKHSDKCPAVWLGWATGSTLNRMFTKYSFDTQQAFDTQQELGGLLCRARCPGPFTPAGRQGNQATEILDAGMSNGSICYNTQSKSLVQLPVFYSF